MKSSENLLCKRIVLSSVCFRQPDNTSCCKHYLSNCVGLSPSRLLSEWLGLLGNSRTQILLLQSVKTEMFWLWTNYDVAGTTSETVLFSQWKCKKEIHFVHTLGTGIFFIRSSKILYMFMDVGLALTSLESRCRASSIRPCSTKTSTCKNHPCVSTTLRKAARRSIRGELRLAISASGVTML